MQGCTGCIDVALPVMARSGGVFSPRMQPTYLSIPLEKKHPISTHIPPNTLFFFISLYIHSGCIGCINPVIAWSRPVVQRSAT
jgi:hypothetical protein